MSVDPNRAYLLSKFAYFRPLAGDDLAAILVNGTSVPVAAAKMPLLMAFSTPRSLHEAHAVVKGSLEDLLAFVTPLIARGLIEPAVLASEKDDALWLDSLSPHLREPQAWGEIAAALKDDRCVVLRDAFNADFAAAIHAELCAIDPWPMSEDLAQKNFSSRHHNIYNSLQLPPKTQHCRRILGSEKSKAFVAEQSGRNCAGPLSFSASCYFPDDYSLPHKDALGARSVAFVLHLAKDWDASWGGAFYWVPSATYVPASYNTFILFNVSENSKHFVTQVNARAKTQRLALNGWWQSSEKNPLVPPRDEALPTGAIFFL